MANCKCTKNGMGVVNEPFYCTRMQAYIVRGPKGERGEMGPQGPRGLVGTIDNNATFAQSSTINIPANSNLTFDTVVTNNGNKIALATNMADINVLAGTYFVSWNANHIAGDAPQAITFAILANGVPILSTTVQNQPSNNTITSISGSTMLNFANNTRLNLANIGESPANLSNITFSIINLL